MKSSLLAAFSAVAAAVSALTPPDYSQGPSGNPIYTPGLDEQVPVGKPYEITWDPTTEGRISIQLLRGPSENVVPIATLADSIANDGSFTWTPSTDLEPDTSRYGLLLVVEGTGQYQYSTQFGIKNDNNPSPSSSSEEPTSKKPTPTTPTTPTMSTSSAPHKPTSGPDEGKGKGSTSSSAPMTTITSTRYVPHPTGKLPTPTHVRPTYSLAPTPTPSSIQPPPYDGAAGRNSVGLAGVAGVAVAAVLAF